MVQRFRKKPVVVEAIQFTKDNMDECLMFCSFSSKRTENDIVVGSYLCSLGDYIIKDIDGFFHVYAGDVFNKTHESDELIQEGNKSVGANESKTPIILFDRSIIPNGVNVDDFIEDINSGRPTGVSLGGRSIKDVIVVINR